MSEVGPMASKFKHTEVCARCSETGHKDDTCSKAFMCVNCEENHTSYNKKGSVYKQEYDIQIIRVARNISNSDQINHPSPNHI